MSWSKTLLFLTVVIVSGSITPSSSDGPVYKEVGDTVVLSPGVVKNPITNILWKHGGDIAMEWNNKYSESYRQFKERGFVNSSSGELRITGLTKEDSGIYTSEISFIVTNNIELLVIAPVSTPTVSTWCDKEMTHCVLTCEGGTSEAEPITYMWESGDRQWNSAKEHNITKMEKEPLFSCILHNPISNKRSKEVANPFISSNMNRLHLFFIPVGVIAVCVILFILICRRRRETSQTMENGQGPNQYQLVNNQVPADQENQDLTSVVLHNTNSVTETSQTMEYGQGPNQYQMVNNQVPADQENQDLTSVVLHDTNSVTETSQTMENGQGPNQYQLVNNQVSADQENQDLTSVVLHDTNSVTETTPVMQRSQETLDQDQPVDNPAAPRDDQGITTQDPRLFVPDDDMVTPQQGQETSNQDPPVDNQEADPQDEEQS